MRWKIAWYYERIAEKMAMFVVWHLLPARVRMWATVRAGADATQGPYSNQIVPELLFMDALKRAFPEKARNRANCAGAANEVSDGSGDGT
jgi:hypothetical protein